ncbi:MAG: thermonuclease family protein [Armatimonadota bacterium]|jgi:micrococcal nuclease
MARRNSTPVIVVVTVLLAAVCHAQSLALVTDGVAWAPVHLLPDTLAAQIDDATPRRSTHGVEFVRLTALAQEAGGNATWNADEHRVETSAGHEAWSFYAFGDHDFRSIMDGIVAARGAEGPPRAGQTPPQVVTAVCERVIDGDTVELRGGERLRYIGMDTPELRDSDPVKREHARLAARVNRALVDGRPLATVRDVEARDRYGRLLGYVYADGLFVNAVLVAAGYAQVATYPPNVRHVELLRRLQREAREAGRGLWADGRADRESTRGAAPEDAGGGGVFITRTGQAYHRDGCSSLSRSKIPISLVDAKRRGYAPCGRCHPPR